MTDSDDDPYIPDIPEKPAFAVADAAQRRRHRHRRGGRPAWRSSCRRARRKSSPAR